MSQAFHTVSESSKEDLLNFGVEEQKIVVIPNGLDASQYVYSIANASKSEELNAIFVGRLVSYKNIETVIRAFREVVLTYPNSKLIILGEGPHKDILVRETKGLERNVTLTGRVSHEEKVRMITESSFVVFPSLIEGFGIAVIEGFACKRPVIVSNIRPLSDIVPEGHSGYIVSPFDHNQWAKRMISLFSNVGKRLEMGNNAYDEFISKYEMNKISVMLENLYKLSSKALN